jgi:hypothetical protein
MSHSMPRAMAAALAGALVGAACLTVAFARNPVVALEMDRDLPRITSGFHPIERNRDDTFAWTGRSAALRLPGLNRRVPWHCSVRVRGARSAPLPQPVVEIAVDGITLTSRTVTNEYQDLEVEVPAQPSRPGFILTIASSTTFVPGPSDRRELGVQVDRLVCRPAGEGLLLPPRRALLTAAISGAVFGAGLVLIGLTVQGAVAGALLVAIAQAVPLSTGPAPYSVYQARAAWAAVWIAVVMVLTVALIERWRGRALQTTARFVVAFTACALFVQLLSLLHPLKAVIDAVFHAHRLQWVLDGRYYFTQPLPDGVRFPYAIGLYVFAAPWAGIARDHVALLRIVVSATYAVAGALLYPIVVRVWGDRLAGATAVVLFHLVPLPYVVLGNANLTYAFGASVAFATMTAATLWALRSRDFLQLAALFLLCSFAYLSHVGVFPLLLAALVALAVLYRWLGGPALRAPSVAICLAATLAAVLSIVAYYGQFGESYETLNRVRARGAVTAPAAGGSPSVNAQTQKPANSGIAIPRHLRALRAVRLAVTDLGGPILLLAVAGGWRVWAGGVRDRLALMLTAMGLTYVAFVVMSVAAPVEPGFQRYTDEFISRLNYSTIPAAVILAARGASWGWGAGMTTRIASTALVLAAAISGIQKWIAWLQ